MQKECSETERNFDEINNQLEQYEKMVSSSQYRQEENLNNQLIFQKKQELSSVDLNISILNEKLKVAESQLRSAENRKEDLLREIAQANDEKDEEEIKIQELKKNINSLMTRRMRVQDRLNQKKNELTVLNRRKEGFCIFGRPSSTEIAAKNDEVQQLEKEKNELDNEIKEKERYHRIAVENARRAEAKWQRRQAQLARTYSDMYSFSCQQSELEIEMENANMTRRELARNIAHIDCELELGRDAETRVKERIERLKEQKKDYRKKANDLRCEIKGKRIDIMILKAEQAGKENELKKEEKEFVKMKKSLWEIVQKIRETERMRNTITSKIGSLELEKRTVKETIDRTQNEVQTAKDRVKVVLEEQDRIAQRRKSIGVNVVQEQVERRNRRAEERLRISSRQVNSDLVKHT